MIGSNFGRLLKLHGNDVTLAGRTPPPSGTALASFPFLVGDYTKGDFTETVVAPFSAIVFAAGNDIRHLPKGSDQDEFRRTTQIEGVPNFVSIAKRAGVRRFVQIGSYYHQVMPHLIKTHPYIRARHLADEGARVLATRDFNVSTLNAPSIVSAERYQTFIHWAKGERPDVPYFAPPGGTNYMSLRSLSEAIWGAVKNAQSGKAYLIGDENLTFRAFFQKIFDALKNPNKLEERNEEHPLLPDALISPGRGTILAYEPDPVETALLGYHRGDIDRAITELATTGNAS